jgi:hypothetical protein
VFDLPSEKMIDIQREVIKNDMDYNKIAPINQFNEPTMSVSANCPNLIMSLANHRTVVNTKNEGTEKEAEVYKDHSDAMRIGRAGIADHRYKDPKQANRMISPIMGSGGGFFG